MIPYAEIQRLEEQASGLEQSLSAKSGMSLPAIRMETERIRMEAAAQKQVYQELRVQLELTNVAIGSEAPIFQIMERAEIPDRKSGPSRGMICIIATGGAFFFAVFLVLLLDVIDEIKKDPEAMAKFKSKKRAAKKIPRMTRYSSPPAP